MLASLASLVGVQPAANDWKVQDKGHFIAFNYVNPCLVHRRHHESQHRSGVLVHLTSQDMPMQIGCLGGEDKARPVVNHF
eukprot:7076-Eustigmatos_ZCMA.PRE.1